jgi:hypothetical protein
MADNQFDDEPKPSNKGKPIKILPSSFIFKLPEAHKKVEDY